MSQIKEKVWIYSRTSFVEQLKINALETPTRFINCCDVNKHLKAHSSTEEKFEPKLEKH